MDLVVTKEAHRSTWPACPVNLVRITSPFFFLFFILKSSNNLNMGGGWTNHTSYDSVIMTGQLEWQDRLYEQNLPFFNAASSIITNYNVCIINRLAFHNSFSAFVVVPRYIFI